MSKPAKICACGLPVKKHPKCPVCQALCGPGHDSRLVRYRKSNVCDVCAGRWRRIEAKENSNVTFYEFKRGMRMPIIKNQNVLTPKEMKVLDCMYRGLSDKQIAWQMKITTQVVKNKATLIYKKLQVQSRTEAIYKAIQLKIINIKPEVKR